jgi:hypothetical protein
MWQPEVSGVVGDTLYTPDISAIVREIIGLDGWASGNAMCIMFGHTSGAGVRWVESSQSMTNADFGMDDIMTPVLMTASATAGGGGMTVSETYGVSNPLDSAEQDVVAGTMYLDSVRAISGRLSALGVSHGKSNLSGAFV